MIVDALDLLKDAKKNHYSVGAFSTLNYTIAEAICRAAEETKCPVILMVVDWLDPKMQKAYLGEMSEFDAKNMMRAIVERAAASPIPIGIHLDHCETFEGCARSIKMGATSVMIDASKKSFEENIELTKKVVDLAHACGVSVEAELGRVAGHPGQNETSFTDPKLAKEFVEKTGVDYLAVSIGTVHGVYKEEPKLQYDLIKELNEKLPVPLVMHGASGLNVDQYNKVIENGITKINFGTYMMLEGTKAAVAKAGTLEVPMYQYIEQDAVKAMKNVVKEHIGYFRTPQI